LTTKMELSDDTLRGISLLGEEAKINPAAFKDLLTVCFKDATSSLNTAIASTEAPPTQWIF